MPGRALPALIVSETERHELEQLVKRPSTPQQLALRGKIILRASEGESQGQIARELAIGEQMSRCWRRRWQALQASELPVAERLADAPRAGAPATFTLEQITQLYALACAPPEQYGRPLSHWTPRELADELVKQGIVESISGRHVGRLLAEAELKPHQSRYWLHPPRTQTLPGKLKTSARSTNRPPSALDVER
ncbi:helix-turn-helix domain-containing protein [Leptolyngbya iicbica]|uniref:Helix-turn-helix domain-containing protein n=2 Tax=Cyanophyceae TaxID=3028117 RepID=A0A4Q7E9V7_9CYAN|nr:helix-turn-helix domain-containing protein [Leptolyngbya sp. LK]RZM79341.1 helix-turn-helix domain-containing protein [Leptolyngbya sp. LK]